MPKRPTVILLTGEVESDLVAVRDALQRLKAHDRSLTCDVWVMPGASAGLQRSVIEHNGEVWRVRVDFWGLHIDSGACSASAPLGAHGDVNGLLLADCSAVRQMLEVA